MERFPCHDRLSRDAQELIAAHATEVILPRGTELFSQGDICPDILYLSDGNVRVFRRHESGQEITLYFLNKGEQCNVNLNSAFTQTPAVGTAIVEKDISGFLMPPEIVKTIYMTEVAYQQYVFELFTKRLGCMATLVEDLRFKKLDHRLLDWLKVQESKTIEITHEKLASHLGTSREVVSRLLKEFEHNGIVSLHRGMIEVV
jgi:CRP/FNR family transcriptional regulator, anaerobic regulatory protein